MITFWRKHGPKIEFLVIILLLLGNTYMKHSVIFKSIAVAGCLTCLVLYIISETYRTITFWLFLILGLIITYNQIVDFIILIK